MAGVLIASWLWTACVCRTVRCVTRLTTAWESKGQAPPPPSPTIQWSATLRLSTGELKFAALCLPLVIGQTGRWRFRSSHFINQRRVNSHISTRTLPLIASFFFSTRCFTVETADFFSSRPPANPSSQPRCPTSPSPSSKSSRSGHEANVRREDGSEGPESRPVCPSGHPSDAIWN